MKESIDTAKTNLRKLEALGHVNRKRVVGAGYSYEVVNSKKWFWKRNNSRRKENSTMSKVLDDCETKHLQVENPSMGSSLDLGKKTLDDRVEKTSNNKESKTLICNKTQSSSPDGVVDPRHAPIRAEIQRLWLLANPHAPLHLGVRGQPPH